MGATTQYIVIHRSCVGFPGVLACQAAHAAGETPGRKPDNETSVVALVAEKSADLEALALALTQADIKHVLIREPDPPYNGAATAVGVEPQDRARLRPFMSSFKVLR